MSCNTHMALTNTTFNGDFAKLVPSNRLAQELFSSCYLYVKNNSDFHFRFMHNSGEPVSVFDEPVESSTEYDNLSDAEIIRYRESGHFVLSFNLERLPEIAHLGWRTGRGSAKFDNRNVDLLCAKPGDNLGRSLASTHMVFQFHPLSGFLMLVGGSSKVPVKYKVNGVWERLDFRQQWVLYRHSTSIRAGNCEYELEYTIENKFRDAYIENRRGFLASISPTSGQKVLLNELPGDHWIPRGAYVELSRQGSGTFGWITQGVNVKTGDPVAIKEVRVNGRAARQQVLVEIEIGRSFVGITGLLPTLDALCEHGSPNGCCDFEKLFVIMPLARSDFSDFRKGVWQNNEVQRRSKLLLLKGPLEGISALHARGIIHRDVTLRNILVLSFDPPRAVLCDYGKAIEAVTSTTTTLAPEVWTVAKDGPYNSKIDIWAYGYALLPILGINCPIRGRITREHHLTILDKLHAHWEASAEDGPLVDLILGLLAWDPKERLSAEEALRHHCWSLIGEEEKTHRDDDHDKAEPQSTRRLLIGLDPPLDPTDEEKTLEYSPDTFKRIHAEYVRRNAENIPY